MPAFLLLNVTSLFYITFSVGHLLLSFLVSFLVSFFIPLLPHSPTNHHSDCLSLASLLPNSFTRFSSLTISENGVLCSFLLITSSSSFNRGIHGYKIAISTFMQISHPPHSSPPLPPIITAVAHLVFLLFLSLLACLRRLSSRSPPPAHLIESIDLPSIAFLFQPSSIPSNPSCQLPVNILSTSIPSTIPVPFKMVPLRCVCRPTFVCLVNPSLFLLVLFWLSDALWSRIGHQLSMLHTFASFFDARQAFLCSHVCVVAMDARLLVVCLCAPHSVCLWTSAAHFRSIQFCFLCSLSLARFSISCHGFWHATICRSSISWNRISTTLPSPPLEV